MPKVLYISTNLAPHFCMLRQIPPLFVLLTQEMRLSLHELVGLNNVQAANPFPKLGMMEGRFGAFTGYGTYKALFAVK